MDNYLAIENALIERLRLEVPAFFDVLGWADLPSVRDSSLPDSAALVIYDGDIIPTGANTSAGKGAVQKVMQRWMVVVAVRNVRDMLGGADARTDAGLLITQVLKALSGWQPLPESRELVRVNAPKPDFIDGFGYFPLAFEAIIITR